MSSTLAWPSSSYEDPISGVLCQLTIIEGLKMDVILARFGPIALTQKDIIYDSQRHYQVAGLDRLDGIAIEHINHPWLLYLSILSLCSTAYHFIDGAKALALTSSVFCLLWLVAFAWSRKTVLALYFGALRIESTMGGGAMSTAKSFTHALRKARLGVLGVDVDDEGASDEKAV